MRNSPPSRSAPSRPASNPKSSRGDRGRYAKGDRAAKAALSPRVCGRIPGEARLDSTPPLGPRRGAASTSQGHPRTIFRRALERDNLVLAEVTAREIGRVTIAEALELTALVARKQPERYGRFAARWLCLWLEEHEKATLEEVALLVSNLRGAREPERSRIVPRDSEEGLGEARTRPDLASLGGELGTRQASC